jgi:DNA-binding transcriptional LysR family regulator
MDLRHFRSFIAVADCLHFTRAAELLDISVPALSKQIKEAEEVLGTRLLNRTKRAVSLTSAGEIFWVEAKRALEAAEHARESAKRAGRGELGRIAIGYVASTAYSGILQAELDKFRASYPYLEVSLREGGLERLPQLIDSGAIDVAFLRPPLTYPVGIEGIVVSRERFVVALHATSPLASAKSIRPAQLAGERFILPEQQSGTLEVGGRGGFHPQIIARPGRLVAVVTMVSLRMGIAIVPDAVVNRIAIPDVVYREIEGNIVPTEVAVAYRRHEKSPAVRAFIKQLVHGHRST